MTDDQFSRGVTARPQDLRHDAATYLSWVERHLEWLFWACAAGLIPWVAWLYVSEVPRALAHQIRPMAAVLVVAVIAGLLLTAWTYRRNSSRSVMAASFSATAIFISAWFRTSTHTGGVDWAGTVPVLLVVIVTVVVLCVVVIQSELSASPHVRWLPIALTVTALALVPYLVTALAVVPTAQIAYHLKIAWTGLDVFEILALAATGFALHRRVASTVVPATVAGTLLLCDAWLNIIPSTGPGLYEGIAMAFLEVPLAALSFWAATHVPGQPKPSPAQGGDSKTSSLSHPSSYGSGQP